MQDRIRRWFFLVAVALAGLRTPAHAQWVHTGLDSLAFPSTQGQLFARHDTVIAWSPAWWGFLSTDGGRSWENRSPHAVPRTRESWTLTVFAGDYSKWYAVQDSLVGSSEKAPYALKYSSDAGLTWERRCNLDSLLGGRVWSRLYVSWSNPDVLFGLWGWQSDVLGLGKSTDGGRTWRLLDEFSLVTKSRLTFTQDLVDSNLLFVHDDDGYADHIYYSTDQGETWGMAPGLPPFTYPEAMVSGAPRRGVLTAVVRYEFRSSDIGSTWDTLDARGFHGAAVWGIGTYVLDREDSALRIAQLNNGAVLIHSSENTGWSELFPGDTTEVQALAWDEATRTLYGGTQAGVVKWAMPTGVEEHERAWPGVPRAPDYPSPAADRVTLGAGAQVGERIAVNIMASDGRIVRTELAIVTDGGMVTVSLVGLPPGTYVCMIAANGAKAATRVVRVR